MKKYVIVMFLGIGALVFSNCNSAKKATSTVAPKSNYTTAISPVIMSYCSPCHIPDKNGNKKAYDNFYNTKMDIDEIIRRIEMNPGERGYMPFKHPKLSDSVIMVFKKWRDDGLLEN